MIKIILGCIFLLFIINTRAVDTTKKQLIEANRLFLDGDNSCAIKLSEALKQAGVQDAGLYCNLGNGYYKTGKTGLAVLNYEKGLQISPLDGDIINNEALVNRQAGLPTFSSHLPGVNDNTVMTIIYKIINIAGLLFFISGLLYLLSSFTFSNNYNTFNRLVYRLCLFTSLPILATCGIIMYYYNSQRYGVIMTDTFTKTGPGTAAKKVYPLKEGEKVKILNQFENWYKVENYDSTTGWVSYDVLTLIN
jgi:hypothetical protein